MTLTRTGTTDCTSTSLSGTTQVIVDLPTRPQPTREELFNQLFDGLSRLDITGKQVKTLLSQFRELGEAAKRGKAYKRAFAFEDGGYYLSMDMTAHDLLDTVMADKAVAAAGTLHDLANQVFLPEGMVFVHDRRYNCTLEVHKDAA